MILAGTNNVSIYNWNGQIFALSQTIDLTATGINAAHLTVGDLTAPGSRDILVSDHYEFLGGSVGLVWIPNDGTGNFGTPKVFPTWGSSSRPILADVNGDGRLDVLLNSVDSTQGGIGTNYTAGGSTVGVLTNNGDGTFSSEVFWGNQSLFGQTNTGRV